MRSLHNSRRRTNGGCPYGWERPLANDWPGGGHAWGHQTRCVHFTGYEPKSQTDGRRNHSRGYDWERPRTVRFDGLVLSAPGDHSVCVIITLEGRKSFAKPAPCCTGLEHPCAARQVQEVEYAELAGSFVWSGTEKMQHTVTANAYAEEKDVSTMPLTCNCGLCERYTKSRALKLERHSKQQKLCRIPSECHHKLRCNFRAGWSK